MAADRSRSTLHPPPAPHATLPAALLVALETSERGLTSHEAKVRLRALGPKTDLRN
jgi:hypothetical protein